MASSNLCVLRYVNEAVFGTTPANPVLKNMRFVSEALNYNLETIQSQEIRSDRGVSDTVQVRSDAGGDINFEFSFQTFDDLLVALMCQTDWTPVDANNKTLINGIVRRSFSIQKHLQDMTPEQFFNFRGSIINTMSLNIAIGQMITGAFGIMALGSSRSEAQITGATITPAPTSRVFNAVNNIGDIIIDTVPYTGCISSLALNVANNIRPVDCIGSLEHSDMVLGTFECSGNMDIYFSDGTMYDKFLNNSEFGFSFEVDDEGGNMYEFLLPRVKFESGTVVAQGQNTDVMFNATWRALHDSTEGCTMKITRTNA